MINADVLQGNWRELRGQLKQRWAALSDDDLSLVSGNVEELIGRIQKRTGETRQAIEGFLDDLVERGASRMAQLSAAARRRMDDLKDNLNEGWHEAEELAQERVERARAAVRYKPIGSLTSAFTVGLVIGLLVGLTLKPR
jgi:uncharacterized protein YjbJ (UPF0337 family)